MTRMAMTVLHQARSPTSFTFHVAQAAPGAHASSMHSHHANG